MIIRSAVFEGVVDEAGREAFDRHMSTTVLAVLARYPGIRKATVRKSAETEEGAPAIYMVFDLYFDSLADMHAALASPIRQEVRTEVGAVKASFTGRLYHLIQEEISTIEPSA